MKYPSHNADLHGNKTFELHQAGSPYIKFQQDLSSKNYEYKLI